MKPFIDILGASGAVYRFDAIARAADAPAVAGNFIFARINRGEVEVAGCGSTLNLKDTVSLWGSEIEANETQGIFVRLNTLRGARVREHDDIVDKHRPDLVVIDPDER